MFGMRKITFIILIASVGLCLADPPPFKPGYRTTEPPVGSLGYPIGTYLTIEGVKFEHQKGDVKFKGHYKIAEGPKIFKVDTINGYKLSQTFTIRVEQLELPAKGRCVIRGYETGEWHGEPTDPSSIGSTNELGLPTQQGPPPQQFKTPIPWQFVFYFRATSVEQPKDLKVK